MSSNCFFLNHMCTVSYMQSSTCACSHTSSYTCAYSHIHIPTHTHAHTCTHIHTHTHTHTHTHAPRSSQEARLKITMMYLQFFINTFLHASSEETLIYICMSFEMRSDECTMNCMCAFRLHELPDLMELSADMVAMDTDSSQVRTPDKVKQSSSTSCESSTHTCNNASCAPIYCTFLNYA